MPGIVTSAPVTSQPWADPETVIVSAPSAAASSFTTRVNATVPESAPAAMTIWKGSGRAAVKSPSAPSAASPSAEPPAAVRATVIGAPGGAVTPSGSCAVTVTWVEAAPSSTTSGEALKTISGAATITGPSSSRIVSGEEAITLKPVADPEKITDSDPSGMRSSAGVKVKSREALRAPAGMTIRYGPAPPPPSANA